MKILITDGLGSAGLELLKKIPHAEVVYFEAANHEDLAKHLPQTTALVVRSRTQVNEALMLQAPLLKLIVRAGIGLDNIDINAAKNNHIEVRNAPLSNIIATAEHTLAMIFAVSRFIPQAHASVTQGKWDKKNFQGHQLYQKTLSILGLGNIGFAVAQRAQALGMKILAYDPHKQSSPIALCSFDQAIAEADYLSIHVPLTPQTRNLIHLDVIKKMKTSAFLIQCSRGGIVNEHDLLMALEQGLLRGAALDVFTEEPPAANHPLLHHSKVVVTPHLGASTEEAQAGVSLEVATILEDYFSK